MRLGLLHGQMHSNDKEAEMRAFREGEIDVLVATTVIEVGVDVPNATIMIVEDADRFGLLQLHQLRGRIGRGPHPSWCTLLADPSTPEGQARLEAMRDSSDGFELAERDLDIRGAGEVFGERQAGFTDLKLGRLPRDEPVVIEARSGRADPRRRSRSRAARAAARGGRGSPRRRGGVPVQELARLPCDSCAMTPRRHVPLARRRRLRRRSTPGRAARRPPHRRAGPRGAVLCAGAGRGQRTCRCSTCMRAAARSRSRRSRAEQPAPSWSRATVKRRRGVPGEPRPHRAQPVALVSSAARWRTSSSPRRQRRRCPRPRSISCSAIPRTTPRTPRSAVSSSLWKAPGWLGADALVVVERGARPEPAWPQGWDAQWERKYGDTLVTMLVAPNGPSDMAV